MKKLSSHGPRLKPSADRLSVGGSWRDGRSSSSARGYDYRWQKARADYLLEHPLCVIRGEGCTLAATVVDHIKPHRGDMVLFWLRTNWQPACEHCHNAHKQRQEAAQQ